MGCFSNVQHCARQLMLGHRFIYCVLPVHGAGSLRSLIFHRWADLGLSVQPSGSDNGVHASASPLEAAAERVIWLKTSLADATTSPDPFAEAWRAADLPSEMLQRWSENPEEARFPRCTVPLQRGNRLFLRDFFNFAPAS